MFDVNSSELIVLGVVALLVIPPKDLPKAMRFAGHWIGKVRGVASQFRSGFDTIVRESELQEMEKKWAAENARIMREHPPTPAQMLPLAEDAQQHSEDAPPETVEQPAILPVPGMNEPAHASDIKAVS